MDYSLSSTIQNDFWDGLFYISSYILTALCFSITLTYSFYFAAYFIKKIQALKRTLLLRLHIHQQLFPYTLISLFPVWLDCPGSSCQPLPVSILVYTRFHWQFSLISFTSSTLCSLLDCSHQHAIISPILKEKNKPANLTSVSTYHPFLCFSSCKNFKKLLAALFLILLFPFSLKPTSFTLWPSPLCENCACLAHWWPPHC